MPRPLLFDRLSGLAGQLPWIELFPQATPVAQFEIAGRPVLVKRDDLTAEPYGGNKVRKLEFLLAEAGRAGVRRLVTAGAFGSHHALATALYGRQQGFHVTCVLFPQPLTAHVYDVLLGIAAAGAELRFTRRLTGVPFALRRAWWQARTEGACIVPPGGSSALGTLGYVEAALELDAAIRAGECPAPSRIYLAAGTLGTAAGVAVGLALAGRRIPVYAVRITSQLVTNERALRTLVRGALALLQPGAEPQPDVDTVLAEVHLRHDQVGEGYGRETAAGRAAVAAFAAAGLQLDATYTAKAAAALLADPGGSPPPLFWHTLSARAPLVNRGGLEFAAIPEPFRTILASPAPVHP
jgi:D-cysteine desulfhydrase